MGEEKEKKENEAELIRITTAGSVDDGKSTLIGRLLHDCNAVYEDQILAAKKASGKRGKKDIDFSLLLDGLSAEREQNITIDVAYRYFSTPKRRFVIADVPGHEEYTRNMVTGATLADLAIILADAEKGILTQSKRHLFIASLLKIPHILVAINKMDLVQYEEKIFKKIKNDFSDFSSRLGIGDLRFIPVSALRGDMLIKRGEEMSWYGGPTLIDYLENLEIAGDRNMVDFRLPIQLVLRADDGLRGYAGKVEGGIIRKGEEVVVLPSEKGTRVKKIMVGNREVDYAFDSQSATLFFEDEIDASRGNLVARENNRPELANEIEAKICWMGEKTMKKGKSYIMKQTTKSVRCFIDFLYYKINIDNLHREQSNELKLNEIGKVRMTTNEPVIFDSFFKNKGTGSFILIDENDNDTVATGIILAGKKNGKEKKEKIKTEKGAVLWMTGLSGSGKSTIADKVFSFLKERGINSERLDGDFLRETLCKDLGFSKEDRDKNIERAGFIANLLARNGVIVLATFISPYKKQRDELRKTVSNFIEVFIDTPLEICERRDVKGLYKKAREGRIEFFTGISDVYERPDKPEIVIKTEEESEEKAEKKIIKFLLEKGYLSKEIF